MSVLPVLRLDRPEPAHVTLLGPVLIEVPPAAISLYTLVTVSPEARGAWYRRVVEGSGRIDAARTQVMDHLTALPGDQRNAAIRVAQSASLLGRLMTAAARVAAQGRSQVLPAAAAERARAVVDCADTANAAFRALRRQPDDAGGPPIPWRPAIVLRSLDAASGEMDRLMDVLTSPQPDPAPAHRGGWLPPTPRGTRVTGS